MESIPFKLFGEYFKSKRLEQKKSLRQFCLDNQFDAGNISKLERGLLKPPGSKDLEKYARALEIEEGSDAWYEFFDKAAACNGIIPKEILNNVEVLEKLPLLFRTLRGEKVSDEKLEDLIKIIKRS